MFAGKRIAMLNVLERDFDLAAWEDEGGPSLSAGPAPSGGDPEIALMARNGITRMPAWQYHVGGYRYSNLADALAQAGRRRGARDVAP